MRLVVILTLALASGGPGASSQGIFIILSKVTALVETVTGISVNVEGLVASDYLKMLHRFDTLTERIQDLESDIGSMLTPLKNIEEVVRREVRWELTIETMENILRQITSKYDLFLYYQKNTSTIERLTLEDFATEAVSHNPQSLQSTMYSLRDLVMGNNMKSTPRSRPKRYAFKAGLFRELKLMVTVSKKMVCGLEQSPQQLAYSLYGILAMALVKNYSMIQFSYMLLHLFGKGSFTSEQHLSSENYKNISLQVAVEASSVMQDLSNVFWRCDPDEHTEGVTFEQVTELLQGYIENEVDLSQTGSCAGSCSDYSKARTEGCYGATNKPYQKSSSPYVLCERQRRCNGTIHGCRFFAGYSNVCFANASEGTHRRYNWIKFTDGQTLGRTDAQVGRCADSHEVNSWNRGFVQCSYCFCLCDDDTSSERYFSLQPAVSDVSDNKIVTGVRFVKRDGIFYIQIEQGTADEFGYVKASTEQWKPIDRYISINRDTAGRDFFKLSWEQRSVDLQDLRAPNGHVITGVSFHTAGDHLSLKIQVTAIEVVSAEVTQGSSFWISSDNITTTRTQLDLGDDLGIPTVAAAGSWPDSRPGQFVQLAASSMKQDAAQTTLPLLDSQPVAPRPAVWLAGLGLYHKGQKGSGGFLGLRVEMADMTRSQGKPLVETVEVGGSTEPDQLL